MSPFQIVSYLASGDSWHSLLMCFHDHTLSWISSCFQTTYYFPLSASPLLLTLKYWPSWYCPHYFSLFALHIFPGNPIHTQSFNYHPQDENSPIYIPSSWPAPSIFKMVLPTWNPTHPLFSPIYPIFWKHHHTTDPSSQKLRSHSEILLSLTSPLHLAGHQSCVSVIPACSSPIAALSFHACIVSLIF